MHIALFALTLMLALFGLACRAISEETPAGRIISKIEADSLFGPAVQSVTIKSDSVNNWVAKSDSRLMFALENGQVVVLRNKRELIAPATAVVSPAAVFHAYAKAKVAQLILSSKSPDVYFEQRSKVFSITCGDSTLEFGVGCPPWCE